MNMTLAVEMALNNHYSLTHSLLYTKIHDVTNHTVSMLLRLARSQNGCRTAGGDESRQVNSPPGRIHCVRAIRDKQRVELSPQNILEQLWTDPMPLRGLSRNHC